MATVKAVVLSHHKKADGTYNVKIRVFHKGEKRFIDTEHFVGPKQLTAKRQIKDQFLMDIIDKKLLEYRMLISQLDYRVEYFTAQSMKEYLLEATSGNIDFIKFCRDYIDELFEESKTKGKEGKRTTAELFRTVTNAVIDFFRRDTVSVNEITVEFLYAFEQFLRTKRTLVRFDQFKRPTTIESEPLGDTGINSYMRSLRSLFNHARKRHNKPSIGVKLIKHYPFADYSIPEAPETRKRNVDCEIAYKIMNVAAKPGSLKELARDLFKLSFYMCGLNAADIYFWDETNIVNGRFEYNRRKEMRIRKDNAFISVKVVDEVYDLLIKYLKTLKHRYCERKNLIKALSKGMKQICAELGIKIGVTFYWVRHTFGNMARNKAECSKDDVGAAMNHVEHGLKTTDIYIEKDWSIVDKVQKKTIKYYHKQINKMIAQRILLPPQEQAA